MKGHGSNPDVNVSPLEMNAWPMKSEPVDDPNGPSRRVSAVALMARRVTRADNSYSP